MIVDKKRQIAIWIIWLIVFPAGLWFAYKISPPTFHLTDFDYLFTLGVACVVSLIPIVVGNIPFTVTQWISLFAFLQYGLFAEMILSQVITFVVMLRVRRSKEELFAFPLNSFMFIFVSLFSGLAYYLAGGVHFETKFLSTELFFLATLYIFTYFIVNQFLYYITGPIFYKVRDPFISPAFLWEGLIHLIVLPVGMTLYFLYNLIGISSFILVSVPIISTQLILIIYNTTQEINHNLQKAVEIGHRLTEHLRAEEVLDVFVENLVAMFPVDYLFVFDNMNNERLEVIRSYEDGEYTNRKFSSLKKGEGIVGQAWEKGEGIFFKEKGRWRHMATTHLPERIESVLAIPIVKNNTIPGVLLFGSKKKRIYQKYHVMIIDILGSYLAIALENARHYEKTKTASERDPLTRLYNARICGEKINEAFQQLQAGDIKTVSLVMLDIDHFKLVNDNYGHQSGNEILIQVAELLRNVVGNRGPVARYGGEEFVLILPNINKEDAYGIAENIRKTIEKYEFKLHDDLAKVSQEITAKITVSIGVATAPTDTDDPLCLIRYADRALYIGAKRAGRNKVGVYQK